MNSRRWINRRTLAGMLYYTGILHLLAFASRFYRSERPVILMGHRVVDTENVNSTNDIDHFSVACGQGITPDELEKRLEFARRVRKAGNPSHLAGDDWDRSLFYLTFDDGYRDNIENATPVLVRLGIEAIIFVLPSLMEHPEWVPWWDHLADRDVTGQNLAEYGERCNGIKQGTTGLAPGNETVKSIPGRSDSRYLTRLELQNLDADSRFYIGNHTVSHPNLNILDSAAIDAEISGAAVTLAGLPRYLPVLAYPFGYYNDRVLQNVRDNVAVKTAFATGSGNYTDRYCLRRINLNMSPYPLFVAEFLGVFDWLSRRRPA